MSIQKLPTELVLMISSYLEVSDRQSLRISCKDFRAMINLPCKEFVGYNNFTKRSNTKGSLVPDSVTAPHDRCGFFGRLFRPGNIFYKTPYEICFVCGQIRSGTSFPPLLFTIAQGHSELKPCIDCVRDLRKIRVNKILAEVTHQEYDGKIIYFYESWWCKGWKEECEQEDVHYCSGYPGEVLLRQACERCHMRRCPNVFGCEGFSDDFIRENVEFWLDYRYLSP